MAGNRGQMPPLPGTPPVVGDGQDEMVELAPATAAKVGPKPIEVVAIANGYFAPHRKVTGDEFTVPSFKQLGYWMRCKDPVVQKKHEANVLKNNRAVNSEEELDAEE